MNKYVVVDRQPRWHTLQRDINILTAEIVRLTKLPYKSWNNVQKIQTLDAQIMYLEELLAAYERDQKKDYE